MADSTSTGQKLQSADDNGPDHSSQRGLRFGISTLGCAEFDLAEVRALAAKYSIRQIEFRALDGSLDLAERFNLFSGGPGAARDFLLEGGIQVPLIASSFQLTAASHAERVRLEAEAEVGEALNAKWLRVFGGGQCGQPPTAEALALAQEHRAWWRDLRLIRGWTIDLILETHDAFCGAASVLPFFAATGGPMPVLWDVYQTWRLGGEKPAETWRLLSPQIRHLHVADSIALPGVSPAFVYTAPGLGETPFAEIFALLKEQNFSGVVTFEWPRFWTSSLPALDSVLPDWVRLTSPHLGPRAVVSSYPQLLYRSNFDQARIVPSDGPYFHGSREQYDNLLDPGSTPHRRISEPIPRHPQIGQLRLYYEGGDEKQRSARIVRDDTQPQNKVLRFRIAEPNVTIRWDTGPQRKSRVQTELYGNLRLHDFLLSVRVRLLPESAQLRNFPGKIEWFTLMEFWDNAGWVDDPYPFRFGFHLEKPDPAPGTDLFFATAAQVQVDNKNYSDVWRHENMTLPIPFGTWLHLEVYFREGDTTTGRFFAAVTPEGGSRTVLWDIRDFTHHPKNPSPSGMKQLSPMKLYTSAAVVDFLRAQGSALEVDWDDFEMWCGRTPEGVVG